MAEKVKLYGMWVSPFCRRVELALRLKGIPYDLEYIEEDLSSKSPLLLKYNPVHKKIPVLVHNEKPIAESLVILEYIDEIWKSNPILPQDPYQRAMARFWARFIDEKVLPTVWEAYFGAEKEKEKCTQEASQQPKLLEKELNGRDFFGGDSIGYVDIAAIVIAFWFRVTQEELLTKEKFPLPFNWIEKLQASDAVNECRPPIEKHLEFVRTRYEAFKSAAK
ncbi:glutathione S-transferase U7-like [Pistacia vera]|uniref:glutathione S-transferase U7-like n=1 Tax=Pistacia vera TaxID=55513 RepID=UPI001262F7BA|nr:glutathione S-transferase U7-like [Pistacia vera]